VLSGGDTLEIEFSPTAEVNSESTYYLAIMNKERELHSQLVDLGNGI